MSMIRYHKVEIKRKDLYSKDYSRIKYSNNIDEDRKVSHIKKGIVDVKCTLCQGQFKKRYF